MARGGPPADVLPIIIITTIITTMISTILILVVLSIVIINCIMAVVVLLLLLLLEGSTSFGILEANGKAKWFPCGKRQGKTLSGLNSNYNHGWIQDSLRPHP